MYSVPSLPRYAQLVLNLEDISIPASGQLPYWFVWGREEGGEDYEVHRAVPSGPGHRFLHGEEISSFSTFSIPVSSLCPIHIQHSAHYVCITLYTVRSSSCPPSKNQRLVSILPPSPPPRLPSTKKSERGVVEPLAESHAKKESPLPQKNRTPVPHTNVVNHKQKFAFPNIFCGSTIYLPQASRPRDFHVGGDGLHFIYISLHYKQSDE